MTMTMINPAKNVFPIGHESTHSFQTACTPTPFLYLCRMIHVGRYNTLRVKKELDFGLILDDGKDGILLPKRFVPKGARPGDELKVFLYHDGEDRLIATTQQPI